MTGEYARQTGLRLREVRESRGMSLRQVDRASCGEFAEQALGSWERATKGLPAGRLAAYAAWLGVDIRLLLPEGWTPPAAGCARSLGWPLEGTR